MAAVRKKRLSEWTMTHTIIWIMLVTAGNEITHSFSPAASFSEWLLCDYDSLRRRSTKRAPRGRWRRRTFSCSAHHILQHGRDEVSFWSFPQTNRVWISTCASRECSRKWNERRKWIWSTYTPEPERFRNKFTFFLRPERCCPQVITLKRKCKKCYSSDGNAPVRELRRSMLHFIDAYQNSYCIIYYHPYTRHRRVSLALCAMQACTSCNADANELAILI